jgi:nicotinate-nucleotide adenylyltransferase
VIRLPPRGQRQRIGLFGGSFNPAHRGHYKVALYALKVLRLDFVWWMVSPQNPLKDPAITDEYGKRLAYTRRVARHPRFIVTDLEQHMRTRFTAETLSQLKALSGDAEFVWIMGADSLASLHHWHHWLEIMNMVPLAVLARPGYSIKALRSLTATRFASRRISSPAAVLTASLPAWTFITMPLRKESSTAIRKRRKASP